MTTTMIKISKENRQKLNEMKARFNFKSANSTITYLIYIADKCLGKKGYAPNNFKEVNDRDQVTTIFSLRLLNNHLPNPISHNQQMETQEFNLSEKIEETDSDIIEEYKRLMK